MNDLVTPLFNTFLEDSITCTVSKLDFTTVDQEVWLFRLSRNHVCYSTRNIYPMSFGHCLKSGQRGVHWLWGQVLRNSEADSFWCLSKVLDGVQDNYTMAQKVRKVDMCRLSKFENVCIERWVAQVVASKML